MRVLYLMGYPYPEGKNGMMRFQDGVMVTEKFQIKFIPVYGLNHILSKAPYNMTQEERYRVYFGYSHKKEYQELMRQLEGMEEGLMAIHEQVLTQQSLLDFFAQMKEEDRKKQEREEIIAEYKYQMELEKQEREKEKLQRKEEERKRKKEEQKRKFEHEKYNFIIQLIKEGYSVENAEREANRKYADVLV